MRIDSSVVFNKLEEMISNEMIKANRYVVDFDYEGFQKCAFTIQALNFVKSEINDEIGIASSIDQV